MGRVHRTNQVKPPKYFILVTELGGERRFVSAVTSRLKSLGALTRGDRGASFAGNDTLRPRIFYIVSVYFLGDFCVRRRPCLRRVRFRYVLSDLVLFCPCTFSIINDA
jgi:hypothetical protein